MGPISLLDACRLRHPDPRSPGDRIPLVVLLSVPLYETDLDVTTFRTLADHRVTHLYHLARLSTELIVDMVDTIGLRTVGMFLSRRCGIGQPITPDEELLDFLMRRERQPADNRVDREKFDCIMHLAAIEQLQQSGRSY